MLRGYLPKMMPILVGVWWEECARNYAPSLGVNLFGSCFSCGFVAGCGTCGAFGKYLLARRANPKPKERDSVGSLFLCYMFLGNWGYLLPPVVRLPLCSDDEVERPLVVPREVVEVVVVEEVLFLPSRLEVVVPREVELVVELVVEVDRLGVLLLTEFCWVRVLEEEVVADCPRDGVAGVEVRLSVLPVCWLRLGVVALALPLVRPDSLRLSVRSDSPRLLPTCWVRLFVGAGAALWPRPLAGAEERVAVTLELAAAVRVEVTRTAPIY